MGKITAGYDSRPTEWTASKSKYPYTRSGKVTYIGACDTSSCCTYVLRAIATVGKRVDRNYYYIIIIIIIYCDSKNLTRFKKTCTKYKTHPISRKSLNVDEVEFDLTYNKKYNKITINTVN